MLEGNISKLQAVRRPGRGDDGLVRRKDRLRIVAVGVRDLQIVAGPAFHDIGDPG